LGQFARARTHVIYSIVLACDPAKLQQTLKDLEKVNIQRQSYYC
jgi:hypothetical protein